MWETGFKRTNHVGFKRRHEIEDIRLNKIVLPLPELIDITETQIALIKGVVVLDQNTI